MENRARLGNTLVSSASSLHFTYLIKETAGDSHSVLPRIFECSHNLLSGIVVPYLVIMEYFLGGHGTILKQIPNHTGFCIFVLLHVDN